MDFIVHEVANTFVFRIGRDIIIAGIVSYGLIIAGLLIAGKMCEEMRAVIPDTEETALDKERP